MNRRGFTLIEFIVVSGILVLILGLTSVNTLSVRRGSDFNSAVDLLAADLHGQRHKVMTGQGTNGIFFSAASYTLFSGPAYNSSDPSNYTVSLETGLQFQNITLPGTQVVFSRGSGELSVYTAGQDSFILADPQNGTTKTFTLNRYGTIVSQN